MRLQGKFEIDQSWEEKVKRRNSRWNSCDGGKVDIEGSTCVAITTMTATFVLLFRTPQIIRVMQLRQELTSLDVGPKEITQMSEGNLPVIVYYNNVQEATLVYMIAVRSKSTFSQPFKGKCTTE